MFYRNISNKINSLKCSKKIKDIKNFIREKENIEIENQTLVLKGRILKDWEIIDEDDVILDLSYTTKGGGRLPKFKKELSLSQFPKIEKNKGKISDKNVLELKTGKNHIIRILLECIKYIIFETNIVFHKDSKSNKIEEGEESDLINISKRDNSDTVAVYIELNSEEFEHYYCDEKTVVGVNIMELFRVIKSVDKEDIIFLYMEKNISSQFFISTENVKTGEITKTSIYTQEHEEEGIQIPELDFEISLEIPSLRFQKICKDFNYFKIRQIEMNIIDGKIIIKSVNGEVERKVILQSCESCDIDGKISKIDENYIFKGIFDLSYFIHFTKATPLSDKVTIFLKNNGPIMMKYKIVNIGEISFILASIF